MRNRNKYEAIVAEFIHHRANKNQWPFMNPEAYLDYLSNGSELQGLDFICVWQRGDEVFTKECDGIDDFVEIPMDAEVITKHEIEEDWYDQTRPFIEC